MSVNVKTVMFRKPLILTLSVGALLAALCLLPQDRTRPSVPPAPPPSEAVLRNGEPQLGSSPRNPSKASLGLGAPRMPPNSLPASPPRPFPVASFDPKFNASALPPPGAQRIAAARDLPSGLTLDEMDILSNYLRSPLPPINFHAGEFVVRNDIMAHLVQQQQGLDKLSQILSGLALDPAQNSVMRAYAVQHLFLLYENPSSTALRSGIRQALFSALADTSSTTAGTALLALDRLAALDASVTVDDLKAASVKLLLDPDVSPDSRSAACEIAARHNAPEALPALREAARSAPILSLRLAAINALGRLGDSSDHDLLQDLMGSADPSLAPALDAALHIYNSRPQPSTRQVSL